MNDKIKILIADDDADLLDVLTRRCRGLGLDAIPVDDAMSALANADFYVPEIVLLDVRMPGGNGLSVCEMLATDPGLCASHTIIMTGLANERIQRRCREMGAHLVLKDADLWQNLRPILEEIIRGLNNLDEQQVDEIATGEPVASDSVTTLLDDLGWFADEKPLADAPVSATPWILAIDDDPDVMLGLEKRLARHDVRLQRAYRGMDGYRTAFDGTPEAILLDYQMPDGNGEYILRRLKESSATDRVPVIVITGERDGALKRRMLSAGADAYMTKPVVWEHLAKTLRQYTDLKLSDNATSESVANC